MNSKRRSELSTLSRGEEQVLTLLSNGKATDNIARKMGISRTTVHTYCMRLRGKLGLKNFTELIHAAVLLCGANAAAAFAESLYGVKTIEIRFYDRRGRLVAKREFGNDSLAGFAKTKSKRANS